MMAERGTLAFTDVQELEAQIEDYFQSLRVFVDEVVTDSDGSKSERTVELEPEPPTMAGLAHHLGVVRMTLYNYQGREEFLPAIARAKNRIAMFAERSLYDQRRSNGAKFALEVNHGYGREDQDRGTGDGFAVTVIPPAAGEAIKAIPKWEPEGDDDE